jgi:hypothetical protein
MGDAFGQLQTPVRVLVGIGCSAPDSRSRQ